MGRRTAEYMSSEDGGPLQKTAMTSMTIEPESAPMPPVTVSSWPLLQASAVTSVKYCVSTHSRARDSVTKLKMKRTAPAKNRMEAQSVGVPSSVAVPLVCRTGACQSGAGASMSPRTPIGARPGYGVAS